MKRSITLACLLLLGAADAEDRCNSPVAVLEKSTLLLVKSGHQRDTSPIKIDEVIGTSGKFTLVRTSANRFVFVDRRGEAAFPTDYEQALPFSEGYAAVRIKNEWGFIDERGKISVQPRYSKVWPFSDGVAAVRSSDGTWKFLRRDGSEFRPPSEWIGLPSNFSGGLARIAVLSQGSRRPLFGYVDRSGNWAIKPQFEDAKDFHDGLAAVLVAGQWGYIRPSGELAIQPGWSQAGDFHEGLAVVHFSNAGKPSLMDLNGKTRGTIAEAVSPYSEGLAAARLDGKWGYMNRDGEFVIPPTFVAAGNFSCGVATVYSGASPALQFKGVIDKHGSFIWESKTATYSID